MRFDELKWRFLYLYSRMLTKLKSKWQTGEDVSSSVEWMESSYKSITKREIPTYLKK